MKAEHVEILIRHRLEQAQNALNDARILLEHDGSSQSIVNRAYYGMFYAALALLQKLGSIPSKHTGVISTFDREFYHKGIFPKRLSKAFHEAFDLRQTSDYKVIDPISSSKAESALAEAVAFVNAVSAYLLGTTQDKGSVYKDAGNNYPVERRIPLFEGINECTAPPVTVSVKGLCYDASVLIGISGMKDYEIIPEFSLHCLFYNQRGKAEWKWPQSAHEPRFST